MKWTKLEAKDLPEDARQESIIKSYENFSTKAMKENEAQNGTSQPINARKEVKRVSNTISSHNPSGNHKTKCSTLKICTSTKKSIFLTDIP
jgi:hypothetical protein